MVGLRRLFREHFLQRFALDIGYGETQEGGDGGRNREDGDFTELDPRLNARPPGDKGCVQVWQSWSWP